ncbi:phytoene desaturase family protein [uncultured Helicobacter sp.]|uniref:phytoene desaturase family protein n=1 Tax=uncultured Helicobacter sp. TaxID=175537 RepID=UPI003751C882
MNKQNYDIIIIGSGLGGLSCGATLAKNGKKVLVLEQHELIGGCATCFKRKGMLIDAGLHEMDFGSEKTDMKHTVFKKLGLFEKITLVNLPSAWSVKVLDSSLNSKSGGADFDEVNSKTQDFLIPHKSTKEALISYFPHEKKGLEKYFKKLHFQARLNYKFPFDMGFLEFFFAPLHTLFFLTLSAIRQRKVGDMLDKLIKDSKLKKILNINMPYYHYDAWKFNWNFHAIAQANYYHQGVYIKGGSQSLSNALTEIIKENGGEVRARSDVKKILLADKKAVGVAFVDNTNSDSKAKGVQELFAEKIVANCDPRIVYEELLDTDVSKDYKTTQNFTAKTSLLSVYMVFDTNLSKKFKDMDYSTFCIDKEYFDKPFDRDSEDMLAVDLEKRGFVFVNYSKIDSGLSAREDRYFGVITALSSSEEWENLSKEEYKAKKERAKKAFEARLEAFFPGIMKHCIHSEFATPKTIERYTRAKKGVPYGWDQDLEGFFARSRFKSKSVKNLYFASAFGFPGGGFTGALLSGYRTARKMLDPYFYPRQLSLCVLFGVVVSTLVIEGIKFLLG